MYTHTTGDPKVLDVPPPINNDSYPILQEEVEASVKSLKKGKSEGVDNGAGPGRKRGHDRYVTHYLKYDLADRRVANTLDSVYDHHSPKERQPTTMPKLPYHQPDQSSKSGHA